MPLQFVTFGLWFSPNPTYAQIQYRPFLPLVVVLGTACLATPYLLPDYPISWLVFVPAFWIGVTLTPALAAFGVVLVAALPAFFTHDQFAPFPENLWVPPQLTMELLLTGAAILTMMLTVYRENAARLTYQTQTRAQAEAAHNVLMESVLVSMSDGVLITGADGRLILSNPAARSMLGRLDMSAGWANGYGFRDVDGNSVSSTDLAALLEPTPGEATRFVVSLPGTDGRADRFFCLTAQALVHRKERLTFILVADVTPEQTRTRELESFAGTVAHDLNNPLAALAVWMEVAEEEVAEDIAAGRAAIVKARESSHRIRAMIDDYLSFTVTREGVLRPSAVPLAAIVTDVAELYRSGDAPPDIEIDVDHDVQADATLVRQLIHNLIGNSVKYARPEHRAQVRVTSTLDDEGWIRVLVEDRGMGIHPGEEESIFTPFARSSATATGQHGVGLGLALCQAIVQRHHGRISARANEWGGATIEFTLPAAGVHVLR